MNVEELRIKIFKRACKESECFSCKQWMRLVIECIRSGNEVFFGEYDIDPHPLQKYQFKCQLLFFKMSAEKDILSTDGTVVALSDTLKRYDCNCLREKSGHPTFDFWTEVNEYSNKESIKEEIIEYAKRKGIIITEPKFYMPSYTAQMVNPAS